MEENSTSPNEGFDEIFFRDENGSLKVLRNGVISDAPVETPTAPQVAVPTQSDIEKLATVAIEKLGLHFTDEQLRKRFLNITLSYLRRVRDTLEVREALTEKVETGGLGFTPAEAMRVVETLKQTLNTHEDSINHSVVPVSLARRLPDIADEPRPTRPFPVTKPEPVSPVQSVKPLLLPVHGTPDNKPSTPSARPKIQDVRLVPRLTGPIEELRALTIKDFRQLGNTPELAMEKVREKIDLLEEDSFSKRIEGIKAWRESEVYQTYLATAGESLGGRLQMEAVINQRTTKGLPTLTADEIEVIMKLNTLLRY